MSDKKKILKSFFENKGKAFITENGENLTMQDAYLTTDVYALTTNGIVPVCYIPLHSNFRGNFKFRDMSGYFIKSEVRTLNDIPLLSDNYITKEQYDELEDLISKQLSLDTKQSNILVEDEDKYFEMSAIELIYEFLSTHKDDKEVVEYSIGPHGCDAPTEYLLLQFNMDIKNELARRLSDLDFKFRIFYPDYNSRILKYNPKTFEWR